MPRFRFTIWQMMITVAITALLLIPVWFLCQLVIGLEVAYNRNGFIARLFARFPR
jgi:hypothetical protein